MAADGGSIALGPSGIVSIDASGGDSAASNGGATSTGVTTSAFSGAALGAIRIEAHDDVTARAEITANGGTGGGTSGTSAKGGDIAIASEAGNASLEGSVMFDAAHDASRARRREPVRGQHRTPRPSGSRPWASQGGGAAAGSRR